jgi:hypothetical protein
MGTPDEEPEEGTPPSRENDGALSVLEAHFLVRMGGRSASGRRTRDGCARASIARARDDDVSRIHRPFVPSRVPSSRGWLLTTRGVRQRLRETEAELAELVRVNHSLEGAHELTAAALAAAEGRSSMLELQAAEVRCSRGATS